MTVTTNTLVTAVGASSVGGISNVGFKKTILKDEEWKGKI